MNPGRVALLIGGVLVFFAVRGEDPSPGSRPPLPLPPPHVSRPASKPVAASGVVTKPVSAGTVKPAGAVTNRPSFPAPQPAVPPGKPGVLEFDAMSKHVDLNADEHKAAFVFAVTNRSDETVEVRYVNTSCGC